MKMEKSITSLRAYVSEDHYKGKTRFCATRSELATVEALFDVGNTATLVEKYRGLSTTK